MLRKGKKCRDCLAMSAMGLGGKGAIRSPHTPLLVSSGMNEAVQHCGASIRQG